MVRQRPLQEKAFSMRILLAIGTLALVSSPLGGRAETPAVREWISPNLRTYLQQRAGEFEQISTARKTELDRIAKYVKVRIDAGQTARLTFICTHNSRRSQMSQVWAATAAAQYGIAPLESFSGGTETTAMNPRTVAVLQRAGLQIDKPTAGQNPRYLVRFQQADPPLVCFSKVYHEDQNPTSNFCAVMTCSQADQNCPLVKGCALRVALPFDDPKNADDTPEEAKTYDGSCALICREMLYIFSRVKS